MIGELGRNEALQASQFILLKQKLDFSNIFHFSLRYLVQEKLEYEPKLKTNRLGPDEFDLGPARSNNELIWSLNPARVYSPLRLSLSRSSVFLPFRSSLALSLRLSHTRDLTWRFPVPSFHLRLPSFRSSVSSVFPSTPTCPSLSHGESHRATRG
ncbi:hypothetical protein FCM35_KLT20034 [Carex littledalei]|uniref:Uncharacterized protein n=1 Tax=Carex littledalei TaxID=544730 RepID=A0A833RCE9_9POAL|nr:hypothetical protein FCM35_KLT20034 [Carex littledalei]